MVRTPAEATTTGADTVDEDLTRASWAVRRGGLICITMRLGSDAEHGVSVADVRSLVARCADRGLKLVGEVDLDDGDVRAERVGGAGLLLVAAGGVAGSAGAVWAKAAEVASRPARVRQRVVLFMEVTPSVADCTLS